MSLNGSGNFAVDKDRTLNFFHLPEQHPQKRFFSLAFLPQHNQSVSKLELNVVHNLKLELSIGMGALCILLNEELPRGNVSFNECGRNFLRKIKKLFQLLKTVEAIVN
jgi:hypothetical protein